jgi:amino acid adenylation domain-containing protein
VSLGLLVERVAARNPGAIAVRAADAVLTYGELDARSGRAAAVLRELGVRRGDRVGVWHDKSAGVVAAMQGILRLGASYVPIDPLGPARRAAAIVDDCALSALVTSSERSDALAACTTVPPVLRPDGEQASGGLAPVPAASCDEQDLAYVLYTSGSTGRPKGVCLTHRNALAFVEWAAATIGAREDDRFANHAPFHFDLSVLDLYAAFAVGASVSLVPQAAAYHPRRLVELVARDRITVWYSVPSALMLMMDSGGFLEHRAGSLRTIIFAGEPFPARPLARLRAHFADARLFNFYGPTETNVCTYAEVPADFDPDGEPLPIGIECCGDIVWAVRDDGSEAGHGEEGELMVAGPTVMKGYWGREPLGERAYATGDIVRVRDDGSFVYLGRRDHMLKVRGHRIEPAEIERALCEHPAVSRAVVTVKGTGAGARLVAFVEAGADRPSLLALKRTCAERLPRAMIIDEARFFDALPLNANGKVDRHALGACLSNPDEAEGNDHADRTAHTPPVHR